MSNGAFAWEPLLTTNAPDNAKLLAGLFTTYDRPDARLLAEHVLPLLLRMEFAPDGEGRERQCFLIDLDRQLKSLHDRLIVVSSAVGDEEGNLGNGDDSTYSWIWQSIRRLTVGRAGKAVQHAKLWLLHWSGTMDGDGERLEIVVSSANLTRAAFRGQLQAAWRAVILLQPKRKEARLGGWGVLPAFLRELANSAGAEDQVKPFIELLARAECPPGVTFVASVPGRHNRQALRRTPWGVAGLAAVAPTGKGNVRMSILSPFVGWWSNEDLKRWCETYSGTPNRIELVWIDRDHPWARNNCWLLPESTRIAMTDSGATLLRLPLREDGSEEISAFHREHRARDDRWSHAKVYGLQRGNSRRVLVTSANFSAAAWGSESKTGELVIENFELGVCVEQAAWPFAELEPFADPEDAATVSLTPTRPSVLILWAGAVWDGKRILLECRCAPDENLSGEVFDGLDSEPVAAWSKANAANLRVARVAWSSAKRPPLRVELACGADTMTVPVFDERPLPDREKTVPPEVDRDLAEFLRDALLFEQYGGLAADDLDTEVPTGQADSADTAAGELDDEVNSGNGQRDSYGVPAAELARRYFGVVDSWANQVKRIEERGAGDFERSALERDGQLLVEAFDRQCLRDAKRGITRGIGARMAAEELAGRLRHFREE